MVIAIVTASTFAIGTAEIATRQLLLAIGPFCFVLHARNNLYAYLLSITAIPLSKEQTPHETAFIDRICSLHSCFRSDAVRVGNAERKPECTYHQH